MISPEPNYDIDLINIEVYYHLVDYLGICRNPRSPMLTQVEEHETFMFLNLCESLEKIYEKGSTFKN